MQLNAREKVIVDYLQTVQIASVETLVKITNSSASTIRRTLIQLDKIGVVCRVHGGVSINRDFIENPPISEKRTQHHSLKEAIGKYAASLVSTRDSIVLDAGSTTFEVAKFLDKKTNVITPDLNIALLLINKGANITITGGSVDESSQSCIGSSALEFIDKLRPSITFVGCNGWSLESGIMTPSYDKSAFKLHIMQKADKKILVADSSKYQHNQLFEVCPLNSFDMVITDYGLDKEIANSIIDAGINLVLCSQEK